MPARFLSSLILLLLPVAPAAESQTAFFESYCLSCHDQNSQKGDLRLDTLEAPDLKTDNLELWQRVYGVLDTGEMPPRKRTQPSTGERTILLNWIASELKRTTPPLPALRRMNRTEYEHTVQDLLGIDTPLAERLPEDSAVQGFDNVASGLGLSSVLIERYLDAANAAFDGVIRRIPPSPPATRRARLMDNKDNIESVKGRKGGVLEKHGAYVDFTPGWPPARIDAAHPIEDGLYRCRFAVWPLDPGRHRTLAVSVFAGPLFGDGKRRFIGMYDVTGTPEKPRTVEFTTRLAEGHTLHILPWIYPEHVTWRDKHEARPGIGMIWAETHGPLNQDFPSSASVKLFGKIGERHSLSMRPGHPIWMRHRKGVKRHVVHSETPHEDLERILRTFVPRAFRRPVSSKLTDTFVQLGLARLAAGNSFEEAVRAGVVAVLCSPHFLLLNQEPKVDAYTIASRLSYFLWSSQPDAELMRLAAANKLNDPAARRAQVERMLRDPKAERLIKNFTGQWLDLRDIEFTTPDKKLYPEFDALLLRSMLAETRGFFRHMLENDLDVRNFIDSDFAVLNQRLATHYGIAGVRGHENFRVVKLPEDSVRGGVLTQASVLKVTANGTTTSPVLRGVWVLDKLLGQPSLPPPPGIPLVEPDIRGATTIREQLDRHRNSERCARCHLRIDPPGFALEQFDAIGGFRERYRSLGEGDQVEKVNYRLGLPVEKGGQWADGRTFADLIEFRQQLLDQPDAIMRSLAKKLLVYATGRPLGPQNRTAIQAVVRDTKKNGNGLRAMIHAVVENRLFHQP